MCPKFYHSQMNPADIATKPQDWNSRWDLWINGPKFLSRAENEWPIQQIQEGGSQKETMKLLHVTVQKEDVRSVANPDECRNGQRFLLMTPLSCALGNRQNWF